MKHDLAPSFSISHLPSYLSQLHEHRDAFPVLQDVQVGAEDGHVPERRRLVQPPVLPLIAVYRYLKKTLLSSASYRIKAST